VAAKIFSPVRARLFTAALLAVFLAAALGVMSPLPEAQAQPGPDSKTFRFPALNEGDFLLFIEELSALKNGQEPEDFYKEKNVDAVHAMAASMKIYANVLAMATGEKDELEKELGPTMLFTDAEKRLFAKYEDQIMKGISEAERGMGGF
jgi:hypothetical protein